ncbi:uncharacterized protein FIBRA_04935 [Fibroporia radiculosa]|uniref:Uncharacterized protein n=1 Tax=Fibroporia radiculosa TaxID=599839 RepID=J4G870_9APHY|nr:uncharacterized protein FIBRA_04935 [Fibroporia radiculosa]CCM02823.1 predicted protein [Fibroporia radiculosa]
MDASGPPTGRRKAGVWAGRHTEALEKHDTDRDVYGERGCGEEANGNESSLEKTKDGDMRGGVQAAEGAETRARDVFTGSLSSSRPTTCGQFRTLLPLPPSGSSNDGPPSAGNIRQAGRHPPVSLVHSSQDRPAQPYLMIFALPVLLLAFFCQL